MNYEMLWKGFMKIETLTNLQDHANNASDSISSSGNRYREKAILVKGKRLNLFGRSIVPCHYVSNPFNLLGLVGWNLEPRVQI